MDINKEFKKLSKCKNTPILELTKIVKRIKEYLAEKYGVLITKDDDVNYFLNFCIDKWGYVPSHINWELILIKKEINLDYIKFLKKINLFKNEYFNITNNELKMLKENKVDEVNKLREKRYKEQTRNKEIVIVNLFTGPILDIYRECVPITLSEKRKLENDMEFLHPKKAIDIVFSNGLNKGYDYCSLGFLDIGSYWLFCYEKQIDYEMRLCRIDNVYKIKILENKDVNLIPYKLLNK